MHLFRLTLSTKEQKFDESLELELKAGEIVCSGSINAHFCMRHAYADQWGIKGITLSVSDRSDRDFGLLTEKHPFLNAADIVTRSFDQEQLAQRSIKLARGCSE